MSSPTLRIPPALLVAACLLTACGGGPSAPSRDAVGRMDDTSYDRARGTKSGVNARGEAVGVDDFEGGFAWVEHSAPWCGPCRVQAPILRRVAADHDEVSFLVLMTASEDISRAPTQADAAAWASRHGLEPELVVAKYRKDTRPIPQHRFYSPDGQLLYFEAGQLPEAQIRQVLAERIPDWERWKRSGERADWMR